MSGVSSDVYLLVVKGNLRHRVDLLGAETAENNLTEAQRKLREAAQKQWEDIAEENHQLAERPDWAHGAFVYLKPEHAKCIAKALKDANVRLQSKHVLVSKELFAIAKSALDARLAGPGREAFLKQRAGVISEKTIVPLPLASGDGLQQSAKLAGAYNSEGGNVDRLEPPTDAAGVPADKSRRRKNNPLLQLSADLMENRDIDFDLLEYLCAPVSVQQMYPESDEMWARTWQHVCEENDTWLTMREDPAGGKCLCPWCLQCNKWVDIKHLVSKGCRKNVSKQRLRVGPLLAAILAAEQRKSDPGQPSRSLELTSVDGHLQHRAPPPPPPLPPPPRSAGPAEDKSTKFSKFLLLFIPNIIFCLCFMCLYMFFCFLHLYVLYISYVFFLQLTYF